MWEDAVGDDLSPGLPLRFETNKRTDGYRYPQVKGLVFFPKLQDSGILDYRSSKADGPRLKKESFFCSALAVHQSVSCQVGGE